MAASSHLPFRRIKTRVKRSVAPGCAPGPVPKCAALPSAHRPPLAPTCPSRPQHRYTYESELLLLVNFPAELSCLYQFGERLGVGVQPLSLLLEVTGDIGLHVLIGHQADGLFRVALKSGLVQLGHDRAKLALRGGGVARLPGQRSPQTAGHVQKN